MHAALVEALDGTPDILDRSGFDADLVGIDFSRSPPGRHRL
jgi:hypothetical protein